MNMYDSCGIIIQARTGSSRLPNKVLKKINDKYILQYVFDKAKTTKHKNIKIIIATSDLPQDNPIHQFCINNNILSFRGSEQNVLQRYLLAAEYFNLKHIVRLTADNIFTDIDEMDKLIDIHISENYDYSYTINLPIGLNSEIFSIKTLQKTFNLAYKHDHFEHVNEYILQNPSQFNIYILNAPPEKNYPNIRLTIDTIDDFNKASFIIKHSTNSNNISTQQVIKLALQYEQLNK